MGFQKVTRNDIAIQSVYTVHILVAKLLCPNFSMILSYIQGVQKFGKKYFGKATSIKRPPLLRDHSSAFPLVVSLFRFDCIFRKKSDAHASKQEPHYHGSATSHSRMGCFGTRNQTLNF